jgi:Fe-S-cluster-containing dehydrogenase component/CRP-like cAMP-binding protein
VATFVERPGRWSRPFDPAMTEDDVDRLLQASPIRFISAAGFPPTMPLRGILRNDARIRRFRRGDILIKKGDYGGSAYIVLSGRIRVIISGEYEDTIAGQRPTRLRGWFGALSQLWRNPEYPEVRRNIALDLGELVSQTQTDFGAQIFLHNPDAVIDQTETVVLGEGALLGEVGALTRAPRENTVFADSEVQVLEIRFQGLRDLRRYDNGFREYVDDLFRERSLGIRLRAIPLFRNFSNEELEPIIAATEFEAVGDIDWYSDFNRMADLSPAERLAREPAVISENDYIDDLVILAFGFVRVSRTFADVPKVVGFEKSGVMFGLEEIAANWRDGGQRSFPNSIRALGYVNLLRIPVSTVETEILPKLELEPPVPGKRKKTAVRASAAAPQEQPLLEFMIDRRYINGRAAMVIDKNKCVRCDECVKACAVAHDNNPRFVRHGPGLANIQVTNACMHCVDAVCLIGCPTGAIHREIQQGRVVIDDSLCIGCATCANSCPYSNIRMVEIRDEKGNQILDKETHKPVVKATKCDLCYSQPGGPACQRACPHGALERVNLSDWDSIEDLSRRVPLN